MKKKTIVVVSVFAALVLLTVLCFTTVTFRKTEFIFKNQHDQYTDAPDTFDRKKAEECLSSLRNRCLLFLSQQEIIDALAAVPAFKTVSVVTKFPDTVTVYLSERESVYYIASPDESTYYVMDEDLRVFDVTSIEPVDAVRVYGVNENDIVTLEKGKDLVLSEDQKWYCDTLMEVADTFWELGLDYGTMDGLISLAAIEREVEGGSYVLTLETTMGGEFVIPNPGRNLRQRIIALYGVFTHEQAPKDGIFYVTTDGTVTQLAP